jgi:DNA-binding beta-propeller fold protein YncE
MRHLLVGFCGIVALATVLLPCGCGQRIDAPEQQEFSREPPTPDSYTRIYVRYDFDDAADLELARGGLVYVNQGTGLRTYYGSVEGGPSYEFEGLIDPAVLCQAPGDSIVIADRGDTTVKIFGPWGGGPRTTFRDPDWVQFGGIAADDDGNIYVSDVKRNFVRAYYRDGTPRFEKDLADSGFGVGHVLEPRGLFFDGEGLLIADTGKGWVQKVSVDSAQVGIWWLTGFLDVDEQGNVVQIPFDSPVDVAADASGFVYVADQGNQRIFKFTADSESFAVVNLDSRDIPGLEPPQEPPRGLRSITANASRVYALDDSVGTILVWKLVE